MDGKNDAEKEMKRVIELIEVGATLMPQRMASLLRAHAQDMGAALRALEERAAPHGKS